MTKERIACSVSEDRCSAPAGWQLGGVGGMIGKETDKRKQPRFECFACGLPICGRCSKLIDYAPYGKQRICDNCQEQLAPPATGDKK